MGSAAYSQSLPLVPYPQDVQIFQGRFGLDEPVYIRFAGDTSQMAWKMIQELPLIKTERANGASNIWLGTLQQDPALKRYARRNKLNVDTLGPEGYQLLIAPQQIRLLANTEAGLLYGVQSLRQLIRAFQSSGALPAMQIIDFPAFPVRAVMDDISRGPIPNLDFMKKQIRRLSELKINHLSFYIEHVIKTQKHPGFAPDAGITMEEFQELSEYAKAYNIELIGSFQSLGHFRNILSVPEYRHLGATDRMLKPADPAAIQFLEEVYDELAPVCSSPFFNINCDEAWDLRVIKKDIPGSTEAGLFTGQVQPLIAHLKKLGKQPAMWGDILLAHPEIMEELPKETTIITWVYDSLESFSDWIDPIRERGFDFWVAPGVLNSYNLFPDFAEARGNLQNFINEGYRKGAKGVLTTVWDDGGRHFFSRDWYGLAYAADQSWNPNRQPFDGFNERFSIGILNDPTALFLRLLEQLQQLKSLSGTPGLNNAILERTYLPAPGQMTAIHQQQWEEILQVVQPAKGLLASLFALNQLHWSEDLSYWEFTVEHLLLAARTRLSVLQHTKKLQQQPKEESVALEYLTDILQFKDAWQALQGRFEELWLQENRTYWLEEAASPFRQNIRELTILEQRLHQWLATPSKQAGDLTSFGLDIRETDGLYFTYWLFSDAFPLSQLEFPLPDFLEDQGGEGEVRPSAFEWQKYQAPFSDRVDLNRFSSTSGPSVIYAYSRINSPRAQLIRAGFSTSHGLEIILNGEKVGTLPAKGTAPFDPDQNSVALPFVKGNNYLLLKIPKWGQDWQFSFRILDRPVRNRKYKYYLQD